MTERMTPSEVATALDAQHKYDKANYPPANPLFAKAAATIRELEASNKARADIIYAQNKASEIDREKLKIATEALESVNVDASALCRRAIDAPEAVYEIGLTAQQALARIKEQS